MPRGQRGALLHVGWRCPFWPHAYDFWGFEASPVIAGLGFCLGTRAQMFWLEEGLPSSLAPGRRPQSDPDFRRDQGGPPLPFPGYQGTPHDQKACEPAVFKFCRAAVPDQFRILQCLQTNRPRIGKACQAVLASYGQ